MRQNSWEGYPGSQQSLREARPHSPGFQHQEDGSLLPLAIKPASSGQQKKLPDFQHLKGQHGLRTNANLLTPGFTTGAAARKVPVVKRKWVQRLETGQVLGELPEATSSIAPSWNPPHTATCGGVSACRDIPPQPPLMRISLPGHGLLGEEGWQISQRRRARSLFLNGPLLGLICI